VLKGERVTKGMSCLKASEVPWLALDNAAFLTIILYNNLIFSDFEIILKCFF